MQRNLKSYITGFALSLVLTLAAYVIVQVHVSSEHSIISHAVLIPAILALAVAQLIVQLVCLLHLGEGLGASVEGEAGARWRIGIFMATLALVLLVVVGSLWIMSHLNYNMTPAQVNQYMQDQQGGF